MQIPVKDSTTLKRDLNGGNIVVDDPHSRQSYIDARGRRQAETTRLNKLESDMSEIKSMLQQLLGTK